MRGRTGNDYRNCSPLAKLVILDNGTDITLRVSYILIQANGEFHVGSESCRYMSNLDIRLFGTLGDSNTPSVPGFGQKFIGCAPTGTIEIHGPDRLAWTHLSATLEPSKSFKTKLWCLVDG